jgi:hypothetical protein
VKPRPNSSWRWALIGFWLIGALLACAPVQVRAAGEIDVAANTATSDFPHGIDFHLQASSTSQITRVELLYSLADSLTEQLETPAFTSGNSVDVTEKANFASTYVPTGINVTYHWRIEDAEGGSHETEPQTILWKDDRFTWNSVSGDYVTIYSYKASTKFQNYLLTLAEKYIASEMKLYGIDKLVPINVWIYQTKEDFNGTLEPNSQEWAAGSALPALQLIQEIIADGDDYEANRLIPHELSHQILHQATENPFGILPLWLDEGLAVNNENVDHGQYDAAVAQAKKADALMSIRSLISEFPIYSSQASLAYAESYSIVKFMRGTYGDDKLLAFLRAFKDEVTIDQALQQVYGFDQDGLQTAWLAGVKAARNSSGVGASIDSTIGELLSGGTLILLTAAGIAGVYHVRNSRRRRENAEFADPGETIGLGW